MKRLALLLLPLLTAACVEEPNDRGGDLIPIFWIDARTDTSELGSFDRIQEACNYWGLTCTDSDEHIDVVLLILTDHGGAATDETHKLGFAYYDPCNPILWAADDDLVLEHEVGHGFTLEHLNVLGNVMNETIEKGGDYATLDQRLDVLDAADTRCD
jgi:hypothetical protein